ncbi:MAG: PTS glucose transporter subunit IIA, partial [Lachnospiraceae bacterium]|nr:PTS glucose transporter subunit IIA [Lachnospiraceae bacterium]
MGLFKNLFGGAKEETPTIVTEKNTVYSPLKGTVIPLKEIGDGVFSEGILGQGCGIRPEASVIVSPVDGTISQVAETKHAVGVTSKDGVEVLVHVGLDTVSMNGKGFTVYVKEGDSVKCGQKLLSFDRKAIAEAGFPDVTAVLITNTDDYQAVELTKTGEVETAEK